jgi:hypothetical protein
MTVPTTHTRKSYTGNDVATVFAYDYRIYDADDLVVTEVDTDGNETTYTRGVDYIVTGVGAVGGGNVTLEDPPGPLEQDFKLHIDRLMTVIQDTDIRNQGAFYPSTHETVWDKIVMMLQQFNWFFGSGDLSLARCLMLGLGDTMGSGAYDALSNRIENLDDPTAAQDAVTLSAMTTAIAAGGGTGIVEYTTGTRPAAAAGNYTDFIILKDPSQPGLTQQCVKDVDANYQWKTIVSGDPF